MEKLKGIDPNSRKMLIADAKSVFKEEKLSYGATRALHDLSYQQGLRASVELFRLESEYGNTPEARTAAEVKLQETNEELIEAERSIEKKMNNTSYSEDISLSALQVYKKVFGKVKRYAPQPDIQGVQKDSVIALRYQLAMVNIATSNAIDGALKEEVSMN